MDYSSFRSKKSNFIDEFNKVLILTNDEEQKKVFRKFKKRRLITLQNKYIMFEKSHHFSP